MDWPSLRKQGVWWFKLFIDAHRHAWAYDKKATVLNCSFGALWFPSPFYFLTGADTLETSF
jgi:hypothetical protein